MIYQNVLDAVGHTPVIQLRRMVPEGAARVLVKYEGLGVGGSVKTRVAYNMILEAERQGKLHPDSVIVEPTSGNQGIGLALVGAVRGYRVRIIMPDSVSVERRKLIRHYGAEVILIHDEGNIGDAIDRCLSLAKKMQEEDPKVFVPQQFANPANPMVHRHKTGLEILEQVGGPIHGFCSGIGTGGTLTGIGETLKALNPDMVIWAVEPEKRGDPRRRHRGDASPDGHRRRAYSRGFEPEYLRGYLHRVGRGGTVYRPGSCPEGGTDVRDLLRHKRCGGDQPREKIGGREDGGHDPARYRRAVFFHPAVRRIKRKYTAPGGFPEKSRMKGENL